MSTALLGLGLVDLATAIRDRQVSSVEATRACLDRIETSDGTLNHYISVWADDALAAARRADARLDRGEVQGPLHGVPLAHKDMFYRAGRVSTCGAHIRRGFVPDVTATVLQRLDAAGAIQLGTLNMSEFASSPTGHNPHFGPARNPWNPAHITGGSSSGSGGSVAAGTAFGALGSDTGGSIRLPAAMNGVTGIKPTYGRVSRHGAMPLSWSMDHIGPLARSARDCARLLGVIAGADPDDATTADRPVPDYESGLDGDLKGMRIGVPSSYFETGIAPDIAAAVAAARTVLADLGAELVPVDIPALDVCNGVGTVLSRVESSTIHREWLRTRPEEYGPLLRYRLAIGLALPATRYAEALAMRGPTLRQVIEAVFSRCDAVVAPVMPIGVPTVAQSEPTEDNLAWIANAITPYTRPINYLGLPAIAVPCGFDTAGLPIGIQLFGRPFAERRLLAIGHRFQQATDWHTRRPPSLDKA